MAKNKCVVFSGGSFTPGNLLRQIVTRAAYIICADGGVRHAKMMGVTPDLVLGDFDTLTPEELDELSADGVELLRYPAEKDFTDTHLAVLKALEMGFSDIDILAALGGRIDHALANIMLLALPQAQSARIRILEERQEVFLIRKSGKVDGEKGEVVSLLPLTGQVTGISTEGLCYQVPGGVLTMGITMGVSNILCQKEAVISIGSGLLLVIHALGTGQDECSKE